MEEKREVVYDQEGRRIEVIVNGLECCHTIASLEGEQGRSGQPERSCSMRPATTDDESRAHAPTERRARGILGDAVVDARAAEGGVTPPSVSRDLVLGGYMSLPSRPATTDDESRAHALNERRARGILGDAVVDARAADGGVTPPSVSRDLVLGGYMSSHSSPGLSDDDESYRQC